MRIAVVLTLALVLPQPSQSPFAPSVPRAGEIRGRVIDPDHRAVPGARVDLFDASRHFKVQGTRMAWRLPISARSDGEGYYALVGLPEGTYFVQADARPALAPGMRRPEPSPFSPTFFPNTTTVDLARRVTVATGRIAEGIDIVMQRLALFDVTLRITGDADQDGEIGLVLNSSSGTSVRTLKARLGQTSLARFDRVREGAYIVWGRIGTGRSSLALFHVFDIASNVELELPLMPTGSIAGRVVTADGRPLSGQGERVVAALLEFGTEVDPRAPDQATIDTEGRFALHGLFGVRRLRLVGLAEDWRLHAVRIADRDIADGVTVPPGALISGVELVIGR